MNDIRPITDAEARPLRHQVLRPHQPIEACIYPFDDAPDSFHVGAFLNEQLVGVATILHESFPDESNRNAWKLRGMATLPQVRRMGYGAALVHACIDYIAAHHGDLIWCNGRTSALSFYRALGFREHGDEYESPAGTGPHYVLRRDVSANEK